MILFVSGNDTGIGKTFVSSLLLRSLAKKYIKVAYIKPIESGVLNVSSSDLSIVKNFNSSTDNIDFFQFNVFKEPVDPFTAGLLEKKPIKYLEIIKKIKLIEKEYDLLLIEGAGGLMVPIAKNFEIIDLIQSLKAKVILVATPFLGTLNHTFMSLEALSSRKIIFEGVILNFYPKRPNISEIHNPILINNRKIKILGVVPLISKNILKSGNFKLKSFFSPSLGGHFSQVDFLKKCKNKFKILLRKYAN